MGTTQRAEDKKHPEKLSSLPASPQELFQNGCWLFKRWHSLGCRSLHRLESLRPLSTRGPMSTGFSTFVLSHIGLSLAHSPLVWEGDDKSKRTPRCSAGARSLARSPPSLNLHLINHTIVCLKGEPCKCHIHSGPRRGASKCSKEF